MKMDPPLLLALLAQQEANLRGRKIGEANSRRVTVKRNQRKRTR